MTTTTMPVDSRVLYVEHPQFGVADPDRGVHFIRTNHGSVYVGGYWGGWNIYANLPVEEVTVTESWFCTWYTGFNTECGDPSFETRDGEPYCPSHARVYDLLVEWAETLPECYSDHNEDIRTKGSCDYCGSTEVQ